MVKARLTFDRSEKPEVRLQGVGKLKEANLRFRPDWQCKKLAEHAGSFQ